ncbi:Mitogen-activated protein kinase kinase kinase ANP1 [Cytospora mali]|uniref:Autophagy-related protein 1 n=1 Tax=Cytospora mali TaxID=578113 RepID=A0A194W8G7_CYTMA|nr:Mitogen-activated protein kinase kinase kinase ANP1 [Valsa mali]
MSTYESVDMKQTITSHFDWHLGGKIRDGRFGPVFTGLRPDTGELFTAERLVVDEPSSSAVTIDRVLSHLEDNQALPSQPNVVSYLGHQRKEGDIYILTEYSAGGTLQDFVPKKGTVPQPLARALLRQTVLGLEQLQAQGFAVVFLDAKNVFVDNKGGVKIEAPLLDITSTGQALPPTVLTLPELILGQQDMRKADVWLLGIIAAQLLTGDCNIVNASSVSSVAAQIKQAQGPAWELPISQKVASKLDEKALDFLRQCLTFVDVVMAAS